MEMKQQPLTHDPGYCISNRACRRLLMIAYAVIGMGECNQGDASCSPAGFGFDTG